MTPYEFLQQISEPVPSWLEQFNEGDVFSKEDFFASRIVYYPGPGTDGQPVKLFGSTHSCHCFIYVDFGMTQFDIENELGDVDYGFKGYHTLTRIQLSEHDLTPDGWRPHHNPHDRAPHGQPHDNATPLGYVNAPPFGFLEILERDDAFDGNHGPIRLAILFLGADGIAAYDALFSQQNGTSPPFVIVLQDHGFDGSYDTFGQNGLLENIASNCNALPQYLLVADNTEPWSGYERVKDGDDVDGDPGGMHGHLRYIYQKNYEQ